MVRNLGEQKLSDLSAPDLQNAVRILVAHEQAICERDEDAADELLADLEPLLRRLNWAQNEWLRGLSGDLHMLNDEETFVENPYSSQEYEVLLEEAWSKVEDDPNHILRLLRFEQDKLPPARIAYARGRAYSIVGFLNLAMVFMQVASARDPQQLIRQYDKGAALASANLVGTLVIMGIPQKDAELYAEGVRRGDTLIIADVPDDKAQQAVSIMNANGAVNIDTRGISSTTKANAKNELVIPVVEEEIVIGKRQVQSGSHTHTYVAEQFVEENITPYEDLIMVDRRAVTDVRMEFDEELAEVTEAVEEAVVGKTARVVEEVLVGKTTTERIETIRDTVRRANVDA